MGQGVLQINWRLVSTQQVCAKYVHNCMYVRIVRPERRCTDQSQWYVRQLMDSTYVRMHFGAKDAHSVHIIDMEMTVLGQACG